MQIAGHEYKFKARVPMKDARNGLRLIDAVKGKMFEYLDPETKEDKLEELEALWREFCVVAVESPESMPHVGTVDPAEVAECLMGFTKARSTMSA